MSLDPDTLLVICVLNLLSLAVLVPVIMGRRLSPAARDARRSLLVHAGAWIALILSEQVGSHLLNLLLSMLAMIGYGSSNCLVFRALQAWLGPRRGGRAMLLLACALPVGYALGFGHYEWRVGWSNLLIGSQLLILAATPLRPLSRLTGPWRYALSACFLTMAGLTLARGYLGAFDSAAYPSFAAPHPVNLLALVAANVSMVLSNVSLLVAWREEAEQQLRDQALIDPLSGLLNRRGWDELAGIAFAHARRHDQSLVLLMLDLDHFKKINDQHGHEAGDEALRLFARLLRKHLRGEDIVARFGGEEFCILLPLADATAAHGFDQRLRKVLQQKSRETLGFPLDFSAGLACLGNADADLDALRQRADVALYAAKAAGRGRLLNA